MHVATELSPLLLLLLLLLQRSSSDEEKQSYDSGNVDWLATGLCFIFPAVSVQATPGQQLPALQGVQRGCRQLVAVHLAQNGWQCAFFGGGELCQSSHVYFPISYQSAEKHRGCIVVL
jgi:hypothetical protein